MYTLGNSLKSPYKTVAVYPFFPWTNTCGFIYGDVFFSAFQANSTFTQVKNIHDSSLVVI